MLITLQIQRENYSRYAYKLEATLIRQKKKKSSPLKEGGGGGGAGETPLENKFCLSSISLENTLSQQKRSSNPSA